MTDAPIPSRDDVACGPILHAHNVRVKARRVPSARPVVVVPQHEIHDGLAKPSRTCCRARMHGKQRSGTHTASCGGERSRRLHSVATRRRARVTAAALRVLPPKARRTGEFRTAVSAHTAQHCAALRFGLCFLARAPLCPPRKWCQIC